MTPEEYRKWLSGKLGIIKNTEYLKEWFPPEDLESYVKERSFHTTDWDEPIDWINGITIGMAFYLREYLSDNNTEAQFRIQLALFLSDIVREIEQNEE